jgi:hypothetical protein
MKSTTALAVLSSERTGIRLPGGATSLLIAAVSLKLGAIWEIYLSKAKSHFSPITSET